MQPVETLQPAADAADDLRRAQLENETLYAVIKTVSSSLDLDRVLGGIVEIASEATGCHAAFIYFLEGDRLILRAASPRYSGFVGELGFGVEEGLAGWVARTKTPEFIPENAMADPRMKFVPELEEERFQSMVAVPILAKSGDVIGVAVLHTPPLASSTTKCSTSWSTPPRLSLVRSKMRSSTRRRIGECRR